MGDDFSVCIIVGDSGIGNLRANFRNTQEKADISKAQKVWRIGKKGKKFKGRGQAFRNLSKWQGY